MTWPQIHLCTEKLCVSFSSSFLNSLISQALFSALNWTNLVFLKGNTVKLLIQIIQQVNGKEMEICLSGSWQKTLFVEQLIPKNKLKKYFKHF